MMNLYVPRVTIYRMYKYTPGVSTYIDLLLMVRNPNNSRALVSFSPLTPAQREGQRDKIVVETEMPREAIKVDPLEIFQDTTSVSVAQSMQDSQAPDVKA